MAPKYRLTLRQADQAREDFAAILDELDFVKGQLSRLSTRAWLAGWDQGAQTWWSYRDMSGV